MKVLVACEESQRVTMAKWYVEAGNLSKEQRALVRSKTFPGIAKAMATQWGSEESIKDTIIA